MTEPMVIQRGGSAEMNQLEKTQWIAMIGLSMAARPFNPKCTDATRELVPAIQQSV
jgi:hypothetical protein